MMSDIRNTLAKLDNLSKKDSTKKANKKTVIKESASPVANTREQKLWEDFQKFKEDDRTNMLMNLTGKNLAAANSGTLTSGDLLNNVINAMPAPKGMDPEVYKQMQQSMIARHAQERDRPQFQLPKEPSYDELGYKDPPRPGWEPLSFEPETEQEYMARMKREKEQADSGEFSGTGIKLDRPTGLGVKQGAGGETGLKIDLPTSEPGKVDYSISKPKDSSASGDEKPASTTDTGSGLGLKMPGSGGSGLGLKMPGSDIDSGNSILDKLKKYLDNLKSKSSKSTKDVGGEK